MIIRKQMMKYNGENWFTQQNFPFPFSLISSDILWFMATWLEIIGAIALVLGLGTRTVSLSLMIYFARLRLRIL